MSPRPDFRGGRNIAMKVPSNQWDTTLRFYRDIAGLKVVSESKLSTAFEFGSNRLHVDRCDHLSQAEIWLELITANVEEAKIYFDSVGVERRDEIEELPSDFNGFWIAGPSSIIHLVTDID